MALISHTSPPLACARRFSSLPCAQVSAAALLAVCLASGTVGNTVEAQTTSATPAGVDETKIPDWVKKQADNPVKWIIQQENKPKAKTAVEEKAITKKAVAKKAGRAEEEAVVATPAPAPITTTVRAAAPASAGASASPSTNITAKPAEEPAAVAVEAPAVAPIPAVAALAPPPEPKAPPPPLIEELVPINQPQPVLNREVLQAGIRSGRVLVSFTVNTDGSVKDPAVTETSDRLLNRSVIAAVKQWVYKPINKPQTKTVEIAFQLE
jgi:TonB family protein